MACGISATWQWKFLTSAEDPAYQAFWKEMVLALMEGQQDLIQVGASPPLISVGEETTIRGNVLNETFELKRTASVTLEVLSPDGSVQELTPRPTTAEGFTFEQAFTPTAQGVHRLTARSTVESTGAVIEDEAVLLATSESPELAEVNLNESFLRQIATASGGTYVHLSDYGTLHENIAPLDGSLYKTTEHSAWDSKWILIALLGLLLGEWMTRRIGGLA
jgi:hypothetical protein